MSSSIATPPPEVRFTPDFLSPSDMALRLKRTHAAEARCFAEAMHERVAWANENWAAYWADVLRFV